MALHEQVILDIGEAEKQINRLERMLTGIGQGFATQITDSLSQLSGSRVEVGVQVDAQTEQITPAIDAAVAAADTSITIEADATAVATEADTAIPDDALVYITGDFGDLTAGYEQAFDAMDAQFDVDLEFDTAGFTESYQSAMSDVLGASDATVTEIVELWNAELGRINAPDISIDTADATAGLDEATDATDAFSREMDTADRSAERLNNRLKVLAAVAAVAFAGSLVSVGVGYNTLVQQVTAGLETVLGSTVAARDMLAELHEFASTSPFPRQAFLSATQQLLAFGFAAKDIVPTLDAIQQAVAATGGTSRDLDEIVEVFAKIQSTGKITAISLQQLGLRGIDAAAIIGEAFDQSANEIRSSITAGTLDADAAITALTEGMATKFEGATDRVRDTFLGTMDRIKAATRDIGALLTSGFVDPAGGGAAVDIGNELADAMRELQKALGPVVQQFNTEFLPVIVELARTLLPMFFDVLEAGLPIVSGFGQMSNILTMGLQGIANVLELIPTELLAFAGTAYTVSKAFTVAGAAMSAFAAKSKAAGVALSTAHPVLLALTVGATVLATVLGNSSERARELAGDIARLRTEFEGATPAIDVFRQEILSAFDNDKFAGMFDAMGLTLDEFIQELRDGGRTIGELLDSAIPDDWLKVEYAQEMMGLIEALNGGAEAAMRTAVATEQVTQAQVDAEIYARRMSGSVTYMVDAWENLQTGMDETAARTEYLAETFNRIVGPVQAMNQELAELSVGFPDLARAIAAVSDEATRTDRDFLMLAIAAEDAGVSTEQLTAIAMKLGIEMRGLERGLDAVTGALDDFYNAAAQRLPSTGTVFQSLTTIESSSKAIPASMGRATDSTQRFTRALQEANKALREALEPATSVDLERAEIGVERSLSAQAAAAKRVRDAELALTRVRFDAADKGISATDLLTDRQNDLRDAQLSVREAALAEIDARTKLTEVQNKGTVQDEKVIKAQERVADAQRSMAEGQEKAAAGSGRAAGAARGAAQEQIVTARMFTDALIEEAERLKKFRLNLATISEAGFADVAAMIAREGPELAGAMATELAEALESGSGEMVKGMAKAMRMLEGEVSETTEFFKTRLGPDFILEAGIVGMGMSDAFGEGLSFADKVRIAAELAQSGLSREGQAIATIAAQAGEQAAKDYASLLDLEGPTVREAIKIGAALQSPEMRAAARAGGLDVSTGFGDGLEEGFAGQAKAVEKRAKETADTMMRTMKKALGIRSPSQVAADEIGVPFVEGIIAGIEQAASGVDAAVTDLTRSMVETGDVKAEMKIAGSNAATVAGPAVTQTPGSAGPLVGEINIYATDPEVGIRAALTDLESVARRGR